MEAIDCSGSSASLSSRPMIASQPSARTHQFSSPQNPPLSLSPSPPHRILLSPVEVASDPSQPPFSGPSDASLQQRGRESIGRKRQRICSQQRADTTLHGYLQDLEDRLAMLQKENRMLKAWLAQDNLQCSVGSEMQRSLDRGSHLPTRTTS